MRELALFEQYLLQLRQERLQQSHATLLGDLNDEALRRARTLAHEAELCTRILGACRALAADSGQFIKDYLK